MWIYVEFIRDLLLMLLMFVAGLVVVAMGGLIVFIFKVIEVIVDVAKGKSFKASLKAHLFKWA